MSIWHKIWLKFLNLIRKIYTPVSKIFLRYGLKKVNPELFPDFLCIGAQKAGTSWLHHNLMKHPDIFIPPNRYDIQYFSKNFHKPISWYLNLFKSGRKKVKGESMPGYGLISPFRIQIIKQINKKIRIIFIMRDPIERAWSHAKMSYSNSKDPNLNEGEFYLRHFKSRLSMEKGNYLKIISKWEKLLEPEQMLFIFTDEIANEPDQVLNRIIKFLGVSSIKDYTLFPISKKVNAGTKKEIPEIYTNQLKEIYREMILKLENKFGSPVDKWIEKYSLK